MFFRKVKKAIISGHNCVIVPVTSLCVWRVLSMTCPFLPVTDLKCLKIIKEIGSASELKWQIPLFAQHKYCDPSPAVVHWDVQLICIREDTHWYKNIPCRRLKECQQTQTDPNWLTLRCQIVVVCHRWQFLWAIYEFITLIKWSFVSLFAKLNKSYLLACIATNCAGAPPKFSGSGLHSWPFLSLHVRQCYVLIVVPDGR